MLLAGIVKPNKTIVLLGDMRSAEEQHSAAVCYRAGFLLGVNENGAMITLRSGVDTLLNFEMPAEPPDEKQAEAQAETPDEKPAEAQVETPDEKPAEAQVENPDEKPAEAQVENPDEKPAEAPAETPEKSEPDRESGIVSKKVEKN